MIYIKRIGIYWRTLRHLRPGQIFNRLSRNLFPANTNLLSTPLNSSFKPSPFWPPKKKSIYTESKFIFLNKEIELNFPNDWVMPKAPLLWIYNLHYFDGLLSFDTDDNLKIFYITRWIEDNKDISSVAWDPYPTSLRIVNWIKWRWNNKKNIEGFDACLAKQLTHLSKSLEYHLRGNHLLENAKALIFGGCYFKGDQAIKWLDKGLKILDVELSEQILQDGGHFELSPMYHSIIFELVLDLLALSKEKNCPQFLRDKKDLLLVIAHKMSSWLKTMTHPDNQIAFFNDASTNVALSPEKLNDYLLSLEGELNTQDTYGLTHLSNSGYLRLENKNAVLFFDLAEIGPSYIPGHGHADALSIEFSLFSYRLFVNLGTSEYGNGPRRQFERSTAAHSTYELNGKNSSEVWSGFRVGRRAKVSNIDIQKKNDGFTIAGEHNGYRFLKNKPVHKREIIFSQNQLTVVDNITSNNFKGCSRFHIHPDIELNSIENGSNGLNGTFLFPDGSEVLWKSNASDLVKEVNEYSWEFGKKIPTKTIILHHNKIEKLKFTVIW
jgi:uncharacterized heparinase superfamily protein